MLFIASGAAAAQATLRAILRSRRDLSHTKERGGAEAARWNVQHACGPTRGVEPVYGEPPEAVGACGSEVVKA